MEFAALKIDISGGWSSGRGDMSGLVHGLSGSFGLGFIFLGDDVYKGGSH